MTNLVACAVSGASSKVALDRVKQAPPSSSPFPPLQALASASSYGSLETAVPGLRSRLVARQLESVDALVRALQEAL